MSKHRKTRKQKALADIHRKLRYLNKESISPEPLHFKTNIPDDNAIKREILPGLSPEMNVYPYLVRDISKTLILTTAILATQFVLYILLRHHIFMLPGLNY